MIHTIYSPVTDTLSEEKPWPRMWLFGYVQSSCQSMDGCGVQLDSWFEVPGHLHIFVVSADLYVKVRKQVCELE